MLRFFLYALLAFLIFSDPIPTFATSSPPPVDIEIEVGPSFDPNDSTTMDGCLQQALDFFPFDFLGPSDISAGGSCPSIEFDWGTYGRFNYSFCWVRDIYFSIRPFIMASFLFWAILVL